MHSDYIQSTRDSYFNQPRIRYHRLYRNNNPENYMLRMVNYFHHHNHLIPRFYSLYYARGEISETEVGL